MVLDKEQITNIETQAKKARLILRTMYVPKGKGPYKRLFREVGFARDNAIRDIDWALDVCDKMNLFRKEIENDN
jgi:hypothetical protein